MLVLEDTEKQFIVHVRDQIVDAYQIKWTKSSSNSRTPRRTKPASRCRSAEDVKPHQALQAYSSLATTTDLYTDWSAVSHKP